MHRYLSLVEALPLLWALQGCVTTSGNTLPSSDAADKAEKSASNEDRAKAQKKISMAIGEEVGRFSITNQQVIEAPTGYDGTQYTVKSHAGKSFKCEILEPSGLGKIVTWGMASGANAMCTDFTPGSKDKGKTNKASCNALLQAAGKC